MLKDVDNFEEEIAQRKKLGFSKKSLEEATKLSSSQGFKNLRQERAENPQYPKKKIT